MEEKTAVKFRTAKFENFGGVKNTGKLLKRGYLDEIKIGVFFTKIVFLYLLYKVTIFVLKFLN